MPVSQKIIQTIKDSSWIRVMFEAGIDLKRKFGAENVFDFSLGNPNVEPPLAFQDIIIRLIRDNTPGRHGYMSNAGYPEVRAKVADYLTRLHGINFTENEIIMTVGAAGALNVIFKVILEPGANVVIPRPYFIEYDAYIDNYGGIVTNVSTCSDFSLDIGAIAKSINSMTYAVLINSPNNPTGAVYTDSQLMELAKVLTDASYRYSRPIYLLCDEPYRQIVYNGAKVANIFAAYPHSIVVTSFSKSLSLAGERIGYLAVHPNIDEKGLLISGMTIANRILGFVNAPGLFQRVVAELLDYTVDLIQYTRKRNLICEVLEESGYIFNKPMGAFYVFPQSPIKDDIAFVGMAKKENLLLVPGSGFRESGYFRIAFCCADDVIIRSAKVFKRLLSNC